MSRVLVNEVKNLLDQQVVLKGWVECIRYLSNVTFMVLRDRTGTIQVVIKPNLAKSLNLSPESVVELEGIVKNQSEAKLGYEVHADTIKIISQAEELPFPINGSELTVTLDTLLNNRVLGLRHKKIRPIFNIQGVLVQAFQEFLRNQEFLQVFTPKIVASGTEGGTELFNVQYFGEKGYLAQSPQFYKQMLVAAGYERVFEVGPVYRAEPHATARHINEYISLDLEMGFIDSEEDLMDLQAELMCYMMNRVKQLCQEELAVLGVNPIEVGEIPRIPFAEALSIVAREYGKTDVGNDLDAEGERLISEYVKSRWNSDFVFITAYPQFKRPMYAMPLENGFTRSFDLLFRGLEITTGGQRIHNYDELIESIKAKDLSPLSFQDYLQAFRLGMPPHGGLAIGLERLTAQMLGLSNIRQAALFPRDRFRLTP